MGPGAAGRDQSLRGDLRPPPVEHSRSVAGGASADGELGGVGALLQWRIYNFLELRRRLAADGVSFQGTGDTEVLLAAYDRWGLEALPRLNGMWAFILWDGVRRTVVACRDRFGVKPLYYTSVDGVQVFGSEIKAVANTRARIGASSSARSRGTCATG